MIPRYTTVIAGFMLAIASVFAMILNESAVIALTVSLIVLIGLLCTVCATYQIIRGARRIRTQESTGATLPQQVQDTRCHGGALEGANRNLKPMTPIRSALATLGTCSLLQS